MKDYGLQFVAWIPFFNFQGIGHDISQLVDVLVEEFVLVSQAAEHVLIFAIQARLRAERLDTWLPWQRSRPLDSVRFLVGEFSHHFSSVSSRRKFVRLRARSTQIISQFSIERMKLINYLTIANILGKIYVITIVTIQ